MVFDRQHWNCRLSGPALDLLNRNLHFVKVSRWFQCIVQFEKHFLIESWVRAPVSQRTRNADAYCQQVPLANSYVQIFV